MHENETTQEYVARVGTPFAVAMYRDSERKWRAKADKIKETRERLTDALEAYFDEAPNDEDETTFGIAFEICEKHYRDEAAKWEALASEAIRLDLPGTSPGRQEHLDGNGICMKLSDVEEELASSGIY